MQEVYKFVNLSFQAQQPVRDMYTAIDKLVTFSHKATDKLFIYLFGEQVGAHLWVRFCSFDRNILVWFNQLDSVNKGDLLANIFYNEELYAYC